MRYLHLPPLLIPGANLISGRKRSVQHRLSFTRDAYMHILAGVGLIGTVPSVLLCNSCLRMSYGRASVHIYHLISYSTETST